LERSGKTREILLDTRENIEPVVSLVLKSPDF